MKLVKISPEQMLRDIRGHTMLLRNNGVFKTSKDPRNVYPFTGSWTFNILYIATIVVGIIIFIVSLIKGNPKI